MKTTIITFLIVVVCAAAGADQGRTEIGPTDTFPIVIDEPGSYVLTADLTVTQNSLDAIEIVTDDVTLDLGGHVVRGPGATASAGIGILGELRGGVTIRNGVVSGFFVGIVMNSVIGPGFNGSNRFEDLTVNDCGFNGILFSSGTARDIAVHDTGVVGSTAAGFVCTHCSVNNVVANGNGSGISITRGSAEGCTAGENAADGVTLRNATFSGGSSFNNGGDGVDANRGSVVSGTSVTGNAGWGIELQSPGGNNVINCTGWDNTLGNITGCGDDNGCHQNHLP